MTILHITPYYKPSWIYGGPVRSISKLAEAQYQIGASVSVYTTSANGTTELQFSSGKEQRVEGVNIYYFRRHLYRPIFISFGLIWRLLLRIDQYSVIHIHTWWNLTAILSVLICRFKGIRPVFSPRGMLSTYGLYSGKTGLKHFFHTTIGRWLLKGTLLHATSAQEVTECQQIIPHWPYFCLPNVLDLPIPSSFFPKPNRSESFQLLFLSRIHPKKGLDLLFESLALFPVEWELHIAGDGERAYIQQLKELSVRLGIDHQIHWRGWVNEKDRYDLMAQSDLLVLVSQNENFANVVIEALSVGTPVLISEHVGLQKYVLQKQLGWITSLQKYSITAILKQVYEGREHREWIRINSPSIIQQDFAPEVIAQQYIEAYP